MTARTLLVAALVVLVGFAHAQPPKADAPKSKADAKAEPADLNKQLAARVTVERFDGKFKDAIKLLTDKYELPLAVDPKVGEDQAMAVAAMACDGIDDLPVKLPRLVNVRLDTVVKLVAEQVNAKFLVYPDHVKIVPMVYAAYESAVLTVSPEAGDEPLLSQTDLLRTRPLIKRGLVNATFKGKPLSEAIEEIAEATGATLAVSPLLPPAVRQAPVTVRFANTPVDAAVRTLCEMTECGAIEDANVLLVTTRERAAARAKEETQKLKDRQVPVLGGCLGPAFGGLGAAAQPDFAAEIAKLKEQNEQLRKDLDELRKAKK